MTLRELVCFWEDIAIFSPDDGVFVDAQTMIALQIFQDSQGGYASNALQFCP